MNKETLQLYNNRLEKNNVSLQDVLDEVNALSDAPIEKLYLIRNGIEQTDVTGGHKFIEITSDTNNSNYAEVQKDGWIELCGKQWGAYGWITNNSFDFTKYVKIYVEYDFPNAPPDTAYLEFSQSHIAIMTSEDLSGAIYDSGSILPARVLTVPRKIVRCDVNVNQTSNRWCISVANITSRTDYKNYPLRIYNVWFETDGGILEEPELQNKTITPSETQQVVTPDSEFDGLSNVIVEPIPDEYIVPSGTLDIIENGTQDVTNYAEVNVNVETVPNLQDKAITITENGTQNIVADAGYDGLGNVAITTSIAGGSEPSNKNITEIYYEGYKTFTTLLEKNYNKKYDTTENITLYSPTSDYVNYFIVFVNTGYMIVWTNNAYSIGYTAYRGANYKYSYFYPIQRLQFQSLYTHSTSGVKISLKEATDMLKPVTLSKSNYYYSSTYATIEECISAIQSSDTTYTYSTVTSIISGYDYNNTTSCVVATNSLEFSSRDSLINQCGRQISSNENIVAVA